MSRAGDASKSDFGGAGSDNALTISIDGPHFPFSKFREALDSFIDLLTEVDKETSNYGKLTVEWAVSSVRSGSI